MQKGRLDRLSSSCFGSQCFPCALPNPVTQSVHLADSQECNVDAEGHSGLTIDHLEQVLGAVLCSRRFSSLGLSTLAGYCVGQQTTGVSRQRGIFAAFEDFSRGILLAADSSVDVQVVFLTFLRMLDTLMMVWDEVGDE